jgi:peptide subunit release factor RF-3
MYVIPANQLGTRTIKVNEEHLQTIEKYQLLRDLIDSNGIIDEDVLEKLRLNIRSILESKDEIDKPLLDLCLDVIYNNNMKAFGLHNLVLCYIQWKDKDREQNAQNEQTEPEEQTEQ